MRASWSVACFCTLMAAGTLGGAFASDDPVDTVVLAPGSDLPTRVRTNFDEVESCFLVSPKSESIQFIPEDTSSDKYQLQNPVELYGCQATIKNVDENDNGVWELYYTMNGERRGWQFYDVTVISQESETENVASDSTTEGSTSDPTTYVTELTTISYQVRTESNVTITLSKQDYIEDCYLQTPQGEIVKLEEFQLHGVHVYPTSTNFVSCRVVIGSIDEYRIGTWKLCGRHTEGQNTYERCQPGQITWATTWASTTQARFNHVVSYGFSLAPLVRGTGTINTCHVITPGGEDIALLSTSNYPGLQRQINSRDANACNVVFGPINSEFIGDWVLYGTYNGNAGFNEAILPMNFFLYDEDDPHNQAFNITTLEVQNHTVTQSGTLIVHVTDSGVRASCEFITNTGEHYDENSSESLQTATFVNTNNAACRLQLGPFTENMFGDWVLIGKFIRNNILYNELQLPFRILEEDPANPLPDDTEREIQYLATQHFDTNYGQSLLVTTAAANRLVTHSCHIRTPNQLQYVLREGWARPGIEGVVGSGISCGVRVHVTNEEDLGQWTLIARIAINGAPIERRLPFNIIIEDPANPRPDDTEREIQYLATQNFDTSYGESHLVTTAMANRLVTHSCHIRTPNQLQYILRQGWVRPGIEGVEGSGISCGVRVNVTNEEDLGQWMLIARIAINGAPIERRLPFNISIEEGEDDLTTSITTLPIIPYGARMGINITITLSKSTYNEDCYLHSPQGIIAKLDDSSMKGVTAYPESNFVQCRVVIGPMDETLLGNWTLCGKRTIGESVQERCQPGVISWAINNPSENWASTTHAHFDHVVHYGFSLAPVVRGTGTVTTCHVITPEGEDITITEESDYPGLELVVNRDTTVCSVRVSVADGNFIGDWVIYGTYNSAIIGFNIVSQPMTFFLYDEDNPYSQAYNVTTLTMETHVLLEGNTILVIVTGSGTRNGCEIITNSGDTYDEASSTDLQGVTFVNNNNAACRLQVGPVTGEMFGEWRLIGKFIVNSILYNELQLPFRIIKEDPANPLPDDIDRTIEYLNAQEVYTSFGNSHTLSTATGNRVVTDSCHIVTPDNLQYILRSGLVEPLFQTVTASGISCGVQVHVNNDDALGKWMLIARLRINSVPIERRLPFTIHVEEEVNAVPNVVTVAEGNSLYLRLEKSTSIYATCVLKGPIRNDADRDDNFVENCGFIVRNMTMADAGTWEIEYGTGKLYRAFTNVSVTARFESPENSILTWIRDTVVNETIGPEDTVFCRVENPSGLTVFQEFGRCRILLDQVRSEHEGVWKMTIGTAGRVLAETFEFVVKLTETDSKAQVVTSVVSEKPSVMLTCQVATEHEVTACKFRDPSGKVMLASQGVGEDRYSFHGQEISIHSEVSNRVCGLRITNPVVQDLGLWRCVVETSTETYYGFLTVLCPWAMQDPEVAAAVVSVPTLESGKEVIKTVEGNTVILHCSVQSAIRYCYFRAQNGTVYTVSPGISDWFEYAGEGFDAGECSIRFPALQVADSGRWSCHVGFNEHSEPEQRAQIEVHIDALMVADQYHLSDEFDTLVVHGQVHSQHTLEYCRFVRMDGLGFTSEDVPAGYEDNSLLAYGKCEIRIPNPNILEQHPWTVVAKVVGYKSELTRSTQHTLILPETETSSEHPDTENESTSEYPLTEPDQVTKPEQRPEAPWEHHQNRGSKFMVVWLCVLSVSLILFAIGLLLGPKRNRDWTHQRAIVIRDSIRRSLIKKPLQDMTDAQRQGEVTPVAA